MVNISYIIGRDTNKITRDTLLAVLRSMKLIVNYEYDEKLN